MFLMMKKLVLTPVRELKSSIKGFSEGNPPPTNRLKTGDEFEALYNAFLNMAKKITEYHNSLNDKIKSATENLEETNRKLIEVNRILNEENIKKSDFIARASHELRTPLTSIKGAMDYILAKLSALPPDRISSSYIEEIYIFFDLIRKNSERLIRMVNNMLDLERIEMGVSELHFTNTDLSQLIGETLTYFQIEADRKGISFHTNISDNLYIYADEDRIKQVLINLLSNAIKFSPQDSEINVKAYPNGDFIITEIRDEGPGIPLSEQKKIFEKFYKNGNKEGSGLGLAICKSIIEAHKGIIGVNSRENNGSCFYFKLPVSFRNRDETDNGLIL
jgi:signal transduction histidine kinase